MSGVSKCIDISGEKAPIYTHPFIERPISIVYQASRVAAHTGWGASIGGFTAATAPVSIPLYIYWKSIKETSK